MIRKLAGPAALAVLTACGSPADPDPGDAPPDPSADPATATAAVEAVRAYQVALRGGACDTAATYLRPIHARALRTSATCGALTKHYADYPPAKTWHFEVTGRTATRTTVRFSAKGVERDSEFTVTDRDGAVVILSSTERD